MYGKHLFAERSCLEEAMFEGIQRVWSLKDFGTRFSPAAPTQEGPRAFQLVDDFCAEKASDFNQLQQLSTSGSQQVQHQPLTDLNTFRFASGIWVGAWGRRVQMLLRDHLFSSRYTPSESLENRTGRMTYKPRSLRIPKTGIV
jgi:hypothetical protein